jgi:hypothetical protein
MAKDLYTAIPAGTVLFREGDRGSEMYILESGSVDIVRGGVTLATLEAGDFFGEMAILEDQPRFASATAKSDARVLRIERATFADLLRANVEIAVRIMRKLVGRQRRAEQRISELQGELTKLKGGAPAASAPVATVPIPESPKPSRRSREQPAVKVAEPSPPPPAAAPAPSAPSAPAKPATLRLLHTPTGQRIELPADKAEFLVGRPDPVTGITPDINLVILDTGRSLSRRHAKVLREGLLLFVREEVGTANGTFVNGARLATGATTPLKPGDKVRFGAVELDVVSE